MLSHFQRTRGRAVVWPALAALLVTVCLIGTIRADRQARLTAEEMDTSRGSDQGQGIVTSVCNAPANHPKTPASGQLASNDKDVGPLAGGNVTGQGAPQACGEFKDGICHARYRGGKFLNKVVCREKVTLTPGDGCIPAAAPPQAQSVYVAGGSGSGGYPGATAQPR